MVGGVELVAELLKIKNRRKKYKKMKKLYDDITTEA